MRLKIRLGCRAQVARFARNDDLIEVAFPLRQGRVGVVDAEPETYRPQKLDDFVGSFEVAVHNRALWDRYFYVRREFSPRAPLAQHDALHAPLRNVDASRGHRDERWRRKQGEHAVL